VSSARQLVAPCFAALGLLVTASACRDETVAAAASAAVTSGVGGTPGQSSAGGALAMGGGGAGGTLAPPPPTRVGLEANARASIEGAPTSAERLLAELTAYAAGVRSVTLEVTWADLAEDGGLDALAARVADVRGRGLEVVVVLAVVERRADGRPAALLGKAWDDADTVDALAGMLTAIVDRVGGELAGLVVGSGVDVHLASRAQAVAAITGGLDGALKKLGASRPMLPSLAVGLSYRGEPWGDAVTKLAALGSASAFSYAANLGEASIPNASSPAKDLDAMIAVAAGRPVFLTSVSFTSAPSLGAAPSAQALRLETFFSALQPRRGHFRTVNVSRLHDLDSVSCARAADRQGLAIDAPEITFVCASGLRDVNGAAKLSWQTFLAASAAYAPP